MIGALSYALDVTEGEPPGHAVRTCKIGMRLARGARARRRRRARDLFYALLLKDAGCSANSAKMAALFGADDHVAKRTVEADRLVAAAARVRLVAAHRRAGRIAAGARRPAAGDQGRGRGHARADAGALRPRRRDRAHARLRHARRPRRSARSTSTGTAAASRAACAATEIPLLGRILCLAQTAEIFHAAGGVRGGLVACSQAQRASGSIPRSSTRSGRSAATRAFWDALADDGDVASWEPEDRLLHADDARLDRIADAFAGVVDAKSPWTYRHSDRACVIVMSLADALGADAPLLRDLRRAALLHDIGKLAVSNRILDKPARAHARGVRARPRAPGDHRADPRARPRLRAPRERWPARTTSGSTAAATRTGCAASELTMPMRLLAIADVYEALTSDRPYRRAHSSDEALAIMRGDVPQRLDREAFAALERLLGGPSADDARRAAGVLDADRR